MKKVIEFGMNKQMPNPKIVTINEHQKVTEIDPSNLPYLHRNESVCKINRINFLII